MLLFLSSFLGLFFELIVIRYLSTEIRVFAYLKNLPLVASFLGLGLGLIQGRVPGKLQRAFFGVTALLFLTIEGAPKLHLTHLPLVGEDNFVWGTMMTRATLSSCLVFAAPVLAMTALVIAFFAILGGFIGGQFQNYKPLVGYGINLAGSLAGILVFTGLSFLQSPPWVWLAIGFLVALPFVRRDAPAVAAFAFVLIVAAWPNAESLWSPYYRIDLFPVTPPAGLDRPAAYRLDVNYDYHQWVLDLSKRFMQKYPQVSPNRENEATYELPYVVAPHPNDVLVVGAGTGNDVAAALRHGVGHVDAVEIDPVIYAVGKRLHPEHPYDSPRVAVHIDDARAFFHRARGTYDIVNFGFLDSHTLLSSFSSVRLDNYVYTFESFREARRLLRPGGTLVLAFAAGRNFANERMFATLTVAFGAPPRAYVTGAGGARVVFIEGAGRDVPVDSTFPRFDPASSPEVIVATDDWPFIYLAKRSIPFAFWLVYVPFLACAAVLVKRVVPAGASASRLNLHLFFLGAGFLLLETSAITALALAYGSTWVVNAVVIAAFLLMAITANALVAARPVSRIVSYVGMFGSLGLGLLVPYSRLAGLGEPEKFLASAVLIGLPVFFSGMVFSESFRRIGTPTVGLGFNLLGAVGGGSLENVVMVTGTRGLAWLVIAIYALSWLLLRQRERTLGGEFAR
jgi:SAM-dependent methyltransferase